MDRKYPAHSRTRSRPRQSATPKVYKPVIRANGLVTVGGVIIGRVVPERKTLQIKDSHAKRNAERGTCLVEVELSELEKLCCQENES